jgi:hypothetical protein
MSRLVELEERLGPKHAELIYPCDCGDGDYLRITWDDDDPEWRYLWIESSHLLRGSAPIWKRIKGAVGLLLGRGYQPTEIVLTEAVAAEIAAFLVTTGSEA